MKKIYIWGAGRHAKTVYETIDKNRCVIMGLIDIDRSKQGKMWEGCILIESPDVLSRREFDCIFITAKDYQPVLEQCCRLGISSDKLIAFWELKKDMPYVDSEKKRIVELEAQIANLKNEVKHYKLKLDNYPYEIRSGWEIHIKPSEELLQEILVSRASLCRFGDGEFEIMRGNKRSWFQKVDARLSLRLKEILKSQEENIKIAIADNFGSLAHYTEDAADAIREYLSDGVREGVVELLDKQRIYYDAYVSRPYMMYRDKSHAERVFRLFKEIWKGRRILIVEGSYTRMGLDNDLFSGTAGIKRILCPDTDAFDYYEEILKAVCENVQEDELVLITLGPTATILAFDLATRGIQAIDVGQIDNEYEWYLRGAIQRIGIPGKGVSEIEWYRNPGAVEDNLIYSEQVIGRITGKQD